ncbi:MAG: hypothetical protein A2W62_05475 [Alphaproteobacteria bacterium RIFCSPLOWO2_02_42_7]|nr:MAG: hypothetical protein A2W62_05475 [Alphaproteobacteria bacterium RIFCSPLOWO2_02_42_7]
MTEQFVLQTVRFQENFDPQDKKLSFNYSQTLKEEICTTEEVGDKQGGIFFQNKKNPNAPLIVHFHGGGNDADFTTNKFSTLLYELLKSGFSVYCPHYDSNDCDTNLLDKIRIALFSYYSKHPSDSKSFFIDAFSSGVQTANRFLKARHNNQKKDEYSILGAHYRVGNYEKDFHINLQEHINFPLFVSLAGQDKIVGEPFFGFNMIRYLLDHQRKVDFHFMPTGSHHLIPKDLLGTDKEFPKVDNQTADQYAPAKQYASLKHNTPQFQELYDYVAFKARVWEYFLSLSENGTEVRDQSLFAPERVRNRVSEVSTKFYMGQHEENTLKKMIDLSASTNNATGIRSNATALIKGASPSRIYKNSYGKDGLIEKETSELDQEFIERILDSEADYMQGQEGEVFPAYHGTTREVAALYTIMSLFEQAKLGQMGSSEVPRLRCPAYFDRSRSLQEVLSSFEAHADLPEQKAQKRHFNYNEGFNNWFVAASPWLFGGHVREGSFPLSFMREETLRKAINLREMLFVFFTSQGIKTTRGMLDRYITLAQECPSTLFQIFMSKTYLDEHAYLCEMWGEPIDYLLGQTSRFLTKFSETPDEAEKELQDHRKDFNNPRGEPDFAHYGLAPELQMRIMVDPTEFSQEVVVKPHPRNTADYERFMNNLKQLLVQDVVKVEKSEKLDFFDFDQVLCDILSGRVDKLKKVNFTQKDFDRTFKDPIAEREKQQTTLFEFALQYAFDDVICHLLSVHPAPTDLIKTHAEQVNHRISVRDDARLLEFVIQNNSLEKEKTDLMKYIMHHNYNCAQYILNLGLSNLFKRPLIAPDSNQEITSFPKEGSAYIPMNVVYMMERYDSTALSANVLEKIKTKTLGENKNRLLNFITHYYIDLLHNIQVVLDGLPEENLKRWCAGYFYILHTDEASKSLIRDDKIVGAHLESFKKRYGLTPRLKIFNPMG